MVSTTCGQAAGARNRRQRQPRNSPGLAPGLSTRPLIARPAARNDRQAGWRSATSLELNATPHPPSPQ